jgi:hypothetical protein
MRPTRFATNTSEDVILFQYAGVSLLILWVSIFFFMPMGCGKAQPEANTGAQTLCEETETDEPEASEPETDEVAIRWYARAASDEKADWELLTEYPVLVSPSSGLVFKVSCAGDEDLKKLEDFRNIDSLQYLDLEESDVTDAGLAYLKSFYNLKSLNLRTCSGVTDAGIEHLQALTNLESLDLSGGGCC